MGALSLLRIARRVPGMGNQPELPNLESLIEEEALKTKDEFHIARWVVPLVMSIVGPAVFIPLALAIHPLFLIGCFGLIGLGAVLGTVFHFVAKRQDPTRIALRKSCQKLMHKFVGLKSLLGYSPVLSPKVAPILEEASAVYLRVRPPFENSKRSKERLPWDESYRRAQGAMEEAMAKMLTLAEPETVQAQEVELSKGWAEPLLLEMKAAAEAIEGHIQRSREAALYDSNSAPLAGLREARAELERIDSAVSELQQGSGS
jgi:hypothetical protein